MRIAKSLNSAIIAFFALALLSSCASEGVFTPLESAGPEIIVGEATQTYKDVDSRLWTYFERFEKEAKKRGEFVDLKDSGIYAEFVVTGGDETGSCSYDAIKDLTFININKDVWLAASSSYKEFIVFHHLGICYLGRGYNDATSATNVCLSILRSDTATCTDNYNAATRDAYLDELFTN